jgi:hypothetical protein
MATIDLSDEEREALIRFQRDGIDRDRYPLSPRLAPIRAILAKLEPPPARALEKPRRISARRVRERRWWWGATLLERAI